MDMKNLCHFQIIIITTRSPSGNPTTIAAPWCMAPEFPEQKVIAFTTKPPEELKEHHELEKLFSDYLLKPTMKADLEILLNRYIHELNQKSLA